MTIKFITMWRTFSGDDMTSEGSLYDWDIFSWDLEFILEVQNELCWGCSH